MRLVETAIVESRIVRRRSRIGALILGVSMTLGGCSSGGSDSAGQPAPPPPPPDVGATNNPPTISGSPPSAVKVGESYSFTPTASDPDGDTITFSIQNKPGWASFNTSSGSLTGTPAAGDEGTYEGIGITASDGSESDSMNFEVEVTQVALGSVTLSWTAPTENTDGSALTDLAGYRIYYGLAEGNYPNQVPIDNPGITTYVVENLSPDTYYFVTTALNSSGVESDYSNVAVKTIPN